MTRQARGTIAVTGLAALMALAGAAAGGPPANSERPLPPATHLAPIPPDGRPVIQLALLLDTSNSMDGLIEQAKGTLWSIVNEMGRARHHGQTPQLQVAIYEYGNDGVSAEAGHIRQRAPFTTDLDLLSEQLFGLRTDGGSEHCGQAIDCAVRELRWWKAGDPAVSMPADVVDGSLGGAAREAFEKGVEGARVVPAAIVPGPVVKVIVIAGNEPFTQGSVAYQEAVARARELGVIVNTIHCGSRQEGITGMWEHGARLGGGMYAHIDQSESVAEPPTPYDADLSMLNARLNETYLPYGRQGDALAARQTEMDASNASVGQAGTRYAAKAGALYENRGWDLVDAVKDRSFDLAALEESELPESLRGLSDAEKLAKVNQMAETREAVRQDMQRVLKVRGEFVAQWRARQGGKETTLIDALVTALRGQAAAAGMQFDEAGE